MKNLIYKELRLSVHPLCYLFIFLFPLLILVPNYPLFISFIYVCACFPILFLGANKGQQSNDLIYTALLPVRKKDIVLARVITCTIMLAISMIMTAILSPAGMKVHNNLLASDPKAFAGGEWVGFGIPNLPSLFAFLLVGYAIYMFIYFGCYYKHGHSIVMGTVIGLIFFGVFMALFTLLLPKSIPQYMDFFNNTAVQWVSFIIGIILYILIAFITYKHSSKQLEKVDL